MTNAIYFDMDGTIVDLYGVENWLKAINAEDITPYTVAKPLGNMSLLARQIHACQKKGIKVGIITWTAMGATAAYDEAVKEAKLAWLKKHLPSVKFDEIQVVAYGIQKHTVVDDVENAVLFDDNVKIGVAWLGHGGLPYSPIYINEIMRKIIRKA